MSGARQALRFVNPTQLCREMMIATASPRRSGSLCHTAYHRWSNISSSEAGSQQPQSRNHHRAAVVDGAIYISGGTGTTGTISDLWRRGNASSASSSIGWTLLAEGRDSSLGYTGPTYSYGANVVVSPWGVLSLGGMRQGSGVGPEMEVWVLDAVSKLWRPVTAKGGGDMASSPTGR